MNIERQKKQKIPTRVRRDLWTFYFGTAGQSLCKCCGETEITPWTFVCGHITSEYNGGATELENLSPICQKCNEFMGTTNMPVFMEKCKYPKKKGIYAHTLDTFKYHKDFTLTIVTLALFFVSYLWLRSVFDSHFTDLVKLRGRW